MSQKQKEATLQKFRDFSDIEKNGLDFYKPFIRATKTIQEVNKAEFIRYTAISRNVFKTNGGNVDFQEFFFEFEKDIIGKLRKIGFLPILSNESETSNTTKKVSKKLNQQQAKGKITIQSSTFLENKVIELELEIKKLRKQLGKEQKDIARHRESLQVMNEIDGLYLE